MPKAPRDLASRCPRSWSGAEERSEPIRRWVSEHRRSRAARWGAWAPRIRRVRYHCPSPRSDVDSRPCPFVAWVLAAARDVVRRVEEAWATNDLGVIDHLVAEDLVSHDAFPGSPPGREGAKAAHQMSM